MRDAHKGTLAIVFLEGRIQEQRLQFSGGVDLMFLELGRVVRGEMQNLCAGILLKKDSPYLFERKGLHRCGRDNYRI